MENTTQTQPQQTQSQQNQIPISKIEIKDENIALNVMVAMLNMAQRRGAFSMEESAKTWECIQKFQRTQAPAASEPKNEVVSEASA
tara:strand:- start:1262 stop:1519 length:258 start_codon:yes stop_codon:yes gene_type:complete